MRDPNMSAGDEGIGGVSAKSFEWNFGECCFLLNRCVFATTSNRHIAYTS